MKSPFYKSKQKVEQDYARNAIADYESGDKKAAKYEKTEELEVAAGEGPKMILLCLSTVVVLQLKCMDTHLLKKL